MASGKWIFKTCKNMSVEEIRNALETQNGMFFQTSGSTGLPKTIFFTKEQIFRSAMRTADFFNIQSDDRVFCALPLNYVAGRMMVLRAHLLNWNLVIQQPSAFPKIEKNYKFAVFTPHQFINLFEKSPQDFSKIEMILLGGAPFVDNEILKSIHKLPCQVYLGYGMTETLTHIAIRNLSKNETNYTPLPNVEVRSNENDILSIKDNLLQLDWFETDDMVHINEGKFSISGRASSVINSGGVKIFPESIESRIKHLMSSEFYISSEQDSKLGERVILISTSEVSELQRGQIEEILGKIESPKVYLVTKEIEKTSSGKIIRKKH